MAKVAVVMGTYNPKESFFREQIASIRSQTFQDWVCIISDDSTKKESQEFIRSLISDDVRFIYFLNSPSLGTFRNFEHGLMQVPSDVEFVFWADQDDVWDSKKFERVLPYFSDPTVMMVHHDLKLIDGHGKQFQESCWTYEGRSLEKLNVESMIIKDVVTGCASAFRTSLIKYGVPFLEQPKAYFYLHDQWFAIQALRIGKIYSLRESLTSYRQHGGNQIGAQKQNIGTKLLKLLNKFSWLYKSRRKLVDDYLESVRRFPKSENEYSEQKRRCRFIFTPVGLVQVLMYYFLGKNLFPN